MASDIYTSQIKSNGESIVNKYNSTLQQLKNDIKNLNSTVNKAISEEVDRLIPKTEKTRIMGTYSDEIITKKVRALKSSDYFKITGKGVQDIPDARTKAIAVIKPSDLVRPETINESAWETYNLDEKKEKFFDSLSKSEQQEYIFKGIPDNDKVDAIKSDSDIFFDALTDDDKLYLIAQYSSREDEQEGNRQKFNDKLEKSQKRKDRLKASIKEAADALIHTMEETIKKNDEIIKKLENLISQKSQELLALQQAPIDVSKYYQVKNQQLTPADIKKLEEDARRDAINNLKAGIKDLKDDLITAKDEQKNISAKLKGYKESIEKLLAEKNIYVGSQAIQENTTSSNTLPDAAANKFGMTATGNSKLKQKQKAKNMLENMLEGTDVQDFRDMLSQYSYEDLVSMAVQLKGPFNKRKLNRFFDIALEDMNSSDNNRNVNNLLYTKCGIYIKDLKDMSALSPDKIKKIQEVLTDLNANYSTKPQEEKEQIDLLMDYVKVGMLRRESEHFKFFKNVFGNKEARQRLKMLTVQLSKYAQKQYDEKNGILDRYNGFRKSIHVAEVDKSKIIRSPKLPNRNEKDTHVL